MNSIQLPHFADRIINWQEISIEGILHYNPYGKAWAIVVIIICEEVRPTYNGWIFLEIYVSSFVMYICNTHQIYM